MLKWFSGRARGVVVAGAAIAATVAIAPSARAQLPGLNLTNSDAAATSMAADAEVEIATAYAYLDGRPLFLVSAPPRATEGARTMDPLPVRQRVREIEQNLHRIAREISDPDAIAVVSSEDDQTGLPIIEVNGRYLMTVTSTDNQLRGRNLTQLTRTIETGLARSYRERQPEFLQRQGLLAGSLLVSAVVLS
ncbi:MAG: hypothetical protein AAFX40_14640 [Cyanobacteria bacterium J06639_1]